MYGMLMFAIVAVFVAGLMVGRTPEYLGKKIEAHEMKMASLGILFPCAAVLLFTAIAVVTDAGRKGPLEPRAARVQRDPLRVLVGGEQQRQRVRRARRRTRPSTTRPSASRCSSAASGSRSPALALAGSLAKKKIVPSSAGTLPTHTPLFVAMLVGVIVVVGALTFIPALALGPIVEQLLARS